MRRQTFKGYKKEKENSILVMILILGTEETEDSKIRVLLLR